jgi:hypothetical protein
MAAIHHNTIKKATKLGLTFAPQGIGDGNFSVLKDGKVLTTAVDPKDALDLAILALQQLDGARNKSPKPKAKRKAPAKKKTKPARDDEDIGDDGDPEEGNDTSVVKRKYRMKYKPHKMTCGDDITREVREHYMTKVDPDTKKKRYNWDKFIEFAKRNDCWDHAYLKLNKGMRRMNIVNRLRAKVVRDKYEIVWV